MPPIAMATKLLAEEMGRRSRSLRPPNILSIAESLDVASSPPQEMEFGRARAKLEFTAGGRIVTSPRQLVGFRDQAEGGREGGGRRVSTRIQQWPLISCEAANMLLASSTLSLKCSGSGVGLSLH